LIERKWALERIHTIRIAGASDENKHDSLTGRKALGSSKWAGVEKPPLQFFLK